MKNIAPVELQKLLAAQPGLPLLDVRTPAEYAEVHVPQARNVPLDQLSPKALFDAGQLPKGQPVYLLCRSGGRATKAAEQFGREGFDQGIVVEGGMQAWIEAGLPVTRGAARVISLERQVRIAAGSLVLIGVLLAYFIHPGFIALSAFVGAGLVFAGVTDWCGMGLLLAKMPWNQQSACASGSGCEVKH
ncbi:MAG: rhodanese-like domain-containing protein [Verrucomicrobiota bacterium]|jgi:rhodanese-related sulfurtransferase